MTWTEGLTAAAWGILVYGGIRIWITCMYLWLLSGFRAQLDPGDPVVVQDSPTSGFFAEFERHLPKTKVSIVKLSVKGETAQLIVPTKRIFPPTFAKEQKIEQSRSKED